MNDLEAGLVRARRRVENEVAATKPDGATPGMGFQAELDALIAAARAAGRAEAEADCTAIVAGEMRQRLAAEALARDALVALDVAVYQRYGHGPGQVGAANKKAMALLARPEAQRMLGEG